MNKQAKKIIVLGSLNVDTTQHIEKLPEQGRTIHINDLTNSPGGKGANQAVAAARQGAKVIFIGAVGNDNNGEFMKKTLADNGIDTSYIVQKPAATGSATILLEKDGNNTILVYGGANMQLSPEDVLPVEKEISQADAIVAQFETPIETTIAAFQIAKKHHVMTILNPAPARTIAPKLLALSDFVTPNETEAEALTGRKVSFQLDSLEKTADDFDKLGVKNTIITLGSHGSFYRVNGKSGLIPSFKADAVDTTAAGDTFIGAFAANLDSDLDNLTESLVWASKSASLTVRRLGALESIPVFEEVEKAFRK
ncbi:ribokinase [Oenococcus alcoholitolerans]|uniref:Ribokinase n=1 Tax=Oenococcus alcoholitolerans TaxID=931074 RepID=A0ABR4XT09_9LACO|nr:ribokinase [Oenococcus alcoholitolerans]